MNGGGGTEVNDPNFFFLVGRGRWGWWGARVSEFFSQRIQI